MTDTKTVLIVDDEADVREVLATALQDAGFTTSEAVDGEEGLAKATTEKPDVILLDIMMPNVDGIEMMKRLQQDPWGKNAKVIFLTNLGDMKSISEALEGGSRDYLLKSDLELEDIVKKVQKAIG